MRHASLWILLALAGCTNGTGKDVTDTDIGDPDAETDDGVDTDTVVGDTELPDTDVPDETDPPDDTDVDDTDVPLDCQVDTMEDNDSMGTAGPLPVGVTNNLAACAFDEDWFSLTVDDGEQLDVTSTVDSVVDGVVRLTLYDEDLNVLDVKAGGDNTQLLSWYNDTGAPVATSLKVTLEVDRGGMPGCAYALDTVVSTPTGCVEDQFEDNDDEDHPSFQPNPWVNQAVLCTMTDDDWYIFDVPAGEKLNFTATYDSADGDMRIWLVMPAGDFTGYALGFNGSASATMYDPAPSNIQVRARVHMDVENGDPGLPYDISVSSSTP